MNARHVEYIRGDIVADMEDRLQRLEKEERVWVDYATRLSQDVRILRSQLKAAEKALNQYQNKRQQTFLFQLKALLRFIHYLIRGG